MARFEPYLLEVGALLSKRVQTLVAPGLERDGYYGRLPVLKSDGGLIDYRQATDLTRIRLHAIPAHGHDSSPGAFRLHSGAELAADRAHRSTSSVRARSPIALFFRPEGAQPAEGVCRFLYVLEFYFEEAPLLLGRPATRELQQLHAVLDLLVTDAQVLSYFGSLQASTRSIVGSDFSTASGVSIRAFDATASSPRAELARWLYDIRCAVIHSKKTRRGRPTASFEPYSSSSQALQHVVPLLRWLAIVCIEKDAALRGA